MVKLLKRLDKITQTNKIRRKSINRTKNMELVLMSIPPKHEVPMEIHHKEDQFIRVEGGKATVIIGKKPQKLFHLKDDDAIIIPKNTWHNIKNTSTKTPLKIYSIYSPAEPKNHH